MQQIKDEQKLTDIEKVKLLAFYNKENKWAMGHTRHHKEPKNHEKRLVELKIVWREASFLREYKKYEKAGKFI